MMDEIKNLIEMKRLLGHFRVDSLPTVSIEKEKLREITKKIGEEFHEPLAGNVTHLMGFDVKVI